MKNEIIGYVGSGEFTEEDAKKLTGINLAFGELHNDGSVTVSGCRNKIDMIPQIRKWNDKLRIVLSMVQADRDAFTVCCGTEEMREKAAANLAEELERNGYTRLYEGADWALAPGGRYYVTRSGSALASTAVEILNCYFAPGDVGAFTVPEGALLH